MSAAAAFGSRPELETVRLGFIGRPYEPSHGVVDLAGNPIDGNTLLYVARRARKVTGHFDSTLSDVLFMPADVIAFMIGRGERQLLAILSLGYYAGLVGPGVSEPSPGFYADAELLQALFDIRFSRMSDSEIFKGFRWKRHLSDIAKIASAYLDKEHATGHDLYTKKVTVGDLLGLSEPNHVELWAILRWADGFSGGPENSTQRVALLINLLRHAGMMPQVAQEFKDLTVPAPRAA